MEHLFHNPLARLIAQALLIMVSARLIGLLGRRIGQPMVIAETVAGIVLGPSLLGWLWPGLSKALFPAESMPILGMVSQLGLVLFMFLVGLELDPKLLRGRGRSSFVISQISILVPFALGTVLALYLYPRLSSAAVRFSSFTLFMGVAMSITAFPVLARILNEQRLLRTKIGAIAITCAAVDDVTAWCLLAFVVSSVRATGVLDAVRTTVLAAAYVLVMFGLVRPLISRLAARSVGKEGLTQNVIAVALMALLLSSWITEIIGIHALFGAFLLGAIFPKADGFAATLAEKLEDLVLVFMLPLFFAFSGLRTQVGLLNTPHAWAMCGLIIAVACLGKFGGATLAARWTGLRWREATVIGVLMNTRGLMELVVLNLGLDLGVISPKLFAMMVLMALVTTFLTTPLLQGIYPLSEFARELAEEYVEAPPLAPPRAAFTVLMCVALERSGPGMVTLAGAFIRDDQARSRLYALRLLPPTDRLSYYLQPSAEQQAAAALAPLLARAQELELTVRALSFVSPQPGRDICSVAEVKRVDLVLLGWHKPMLSRNVLGGTVREVMSDAQADVGVLIDRGLLQLGRVLVLYCGTPHDEAAVRLAQRLHTCGAAVTLLGVVATPVEAAPRQQELRSTFGPQFAQADGPGFAVEVRAHSTPAEAAIEQAREGYDLILLGIGPEWGFAQRPIGISAEPLMERCPTSLLIVRAQPEVPVNRSVPRRQEAIVASAD